MAQDDYNLTLVGANTPLDALYRRWGGLVASLLPPVFTDLPQWFSSRLSAFPEEAASAYFITVERDGKLLAILPLSYVKGRFLGLPFHTWQIYWPGDMGINDFICLPGESTTGLIPALTGFLRRQRHLPWHRLLLQNVPEDGAITRLLKAEAPALCLSAYHHDSKYIACKDTYDDSTAGISSKFKRNNRRKLKKLSEMGKVRYEMAQTPAELATAFEQFIEIEAANWKGSDKTALKFDAPQCSFYRQLLDRFGQTGQCRIHSLWLDQAPIASQFALLVHDTYYLLKIGYNAGYQSVGPGGLLLDETIRRFSGHGTIKKISFITGAAWNDDWAPEINRVYNHHLYNNNIIGLTAYAAEKVKAILRKLKHR